MFTFLKNCQTASTSAAHGVYENFSLSTSLQIFVWSFNPIVTTGYKFFTICPFHLLEDIWVVSNFWLSWIKLF